MRTWFNALPPRHHAAVASLGARSRGQPHMEKSASRRRFSRFTARARQRTGFRES